MNTNALKWQFKKKNSVLYSKSEREQTNLLQEERDLLSHLLLELRISWEQRVAQQHLKQYQIRAGWALRDV